MYVWAQLALHFAQELAEREGCAVDVAIHSPNAQGDQRNHHAHLLRTTRVMGPEGLGAKLLTEQAGRQRSADLLALRGRWAELTNQHLEQAGLDSRIDARSFEAQGIQRATNYCSPVLSKYHSSPIYHWVVASQLFTHVH